MKYTFRYSTIIKIRSCFTFKKPVKIFKIKEKIWEKS